MMHRYFTLAIMMTIGAGVVSPCAAVDETEAVQAPLQKISAEDRDFFESKVRPLLHQHCFACHSDESKPLKGGLRLDHAATTLAGGDSGPAIVPGRPDQSLLIEGVGYHSDRLQMPPEGKLADEKIAILTAWVARGAPYPADEGVAEPTKRIIDLEAGRKFWSFQSLTRPEVPAVQDARWIRNSIDAFILAELESHHLPPSREATRATLIRRAYFDLVGLPPDWSDVEAFTADDSPDAYERLIERLLASPQYGERWGRYWLDLVRYCDVPEAWMDTTAQAWLYRDWVTRAFNDDLPYDQFLRLQLAADLMPNADVADLPALGFLGLSPTYWKELKLDHQVIKAVVAEEWEERIHTLMSTTLGLTVACARCHDHKFDPITTDDYYALAGVLASTRQVARALAPAREAAQVVQARSCVQTLETQIAGLAEEAKKSPEAQRQVEQFQRDVESIKQSTPYMNAPIAFAVEDASLHVLPSGPNRTRLEYREREAQDVAVQIRGNPANPGPMARRHFLSVLSQDVAHPRSLGPGSGRQELADCIVTEAGPLAARVMVNRVWKQHFGRGLVETTSNFGAQGTPPSHGSLLEDLAAGFVEHGWSIKWLHRQVMLSATYRQTSDFDSAKYEVDPDNRLMWRMNRRRLDVEAWRDAMLRASGTLVLQMGGAAEELANESNRRRTVYGIVRRRDLNDLLRLYDAPDATTHSPGREPTTTPLQQLFVLNSSLLSQQAAALVARVRLESSESERAQIHRAYQLLFARPATAEQARLAEEFLAACTQSGQSRDEAWREYAQVLLGSNELMFVD